MLGLLGLELQIYSWWLNAADIQGMFRTFQKPEHLLMDGLRCSAWKKPWLLQWNLFQISDLEFHSCSNNTKPKSTSGPHLPLAKARWIHLGSGCSPTSATALLLTTAPRNLCCHVWVKITVSQLETMVRFGWDWVRNSDKGVGLKTRFRREGARHGSFEAEHGVLTREIWLKNKTELDTGWRCIF